MELFKAIKKKEENPCATEKKNKIYIQIYRGSWMLSNHIEYYPIKPSKILYDKACMLYEVPVLENPGAVLSKNFLLT